MKVRGLHETDLSCPRCGVQNGIDWSIVVKTCAHCGVEYKVVQTGHRRWVTFVVATPAPKPPTRKRRKPHAA